MNSQGWHKYTLVLICIVTLVLNKLLELGLDPQEVWGVVVTTISGIIGIGVVDVTKAIKTPTP